MPRFFITVVSLLLLAQATWAEKITVAAAISLKETIAKIAGQYQVDTGQVVEFTFGSSGQLLGQIQQGAPVDLFISAADFQVDQLIKEGFADAGSRKIITGNRLVLITSAKSNLHLQSIESLKEDSISKVAIGEPKSVPAGLYAWQTLQHVHALEQIRNKLILGANVRQVLDYVETGEVSAGIVYATDAAQAGKSVRVEFVIPADHHQSIVYPAVLISKSKKQLASAQFRDYLLNEKSQMIWNESGFVSPVAMVSGHGTVGPLKPGVWQTGWLSIRIALLAVLLASVFALPMAYVNSRSSYRGKGLLEGLLVLPMVLPPTVVGYLIILAMGSNGIVGEYLNRWFSYSIMFRMEGAVLAAATVAFPLLYLPARGAFASVERDVEDVARLHGASPLQVFRHISLPLAARGVVSGLILSFARALGELGATVMVFGIRTTQTTLPVSIYLDYEHGEMYKGLPAVILLCTVSMFITVLYNRSALSRRN